MIDVTLDWETFYSQQYSIRKLGTMGYIRDERFQVLGCGLKIADQPTRFYLPDEIDSMIDTLNTLQHTDKVNLIGQNTKFDGLILSERYGFVPDYYSDTMAMAKGLWPHHPSSLDAVTKRLWPNEPDKHKGDELADYQGLRFEQIEDIQPLATYCIQDVDITYAAYQLMKSWYPKNELDIIEMTTRMFCDPIFELDINLMNQAAEDGLKEKERVIANALKFLRSDYMRAHLAMTSDNVHLFTAKTFSSNKAFPELLEALGLTVPMKRSPQTGKQTPALGKNDVPYINLKRENPDLLPIFEAREIAKSNQAVSRANKLIQAVQGRPNNDKKLVVPLVYYGAHTGRYGGNEGLNLQNLQRGSAHRKALRAPRGQLVYVADSSNIEARLVAWFAEETHLQNQFAQGIDTYATLASDIYGFTVTKATHHDERSVGKVARLGLQYGMGAKTFHRTMESGPMGIAPQQYEYQFTENIVKTYRRTHPKIVQCWRTADQIIQKMMRRDTCEQWRCLVVRHQCLELPNGMFLHFPNLRTEEIQTAFGTQYETVYDSWDFKSKKLVEKKLYGGKLLENIAQALAGLTMKEMMLDIQRSLGTEYNGRVALQVHDEIIAVADDTDPEATMELMFEHMNTSPAWAPDLPLESEGGYDNCYSK